MEDAPESMYLFGDGSGKVMVLKDSAKSVVGCKSPTAMLDSWLLLGRGAYMRGL